MFRPFFGVDANAERGRWIAETRERRPQRLDRRDLVFSILAASAFIVFAAVLPFVVGSHRPAPVLLILLFLAAYAVAANIEFEVGSGYAVPTQLVLVPMLFLLPLGIVPACVAIGLVSADLPRFFRKEAHPERAALLLMSAWHCAGPVAVLAAFGERAPDLGDWHIYVLALCCQFLFDLVVSAGRTWYAFGTKPSSQLAEMASVWAVDAALAPTALFVAVVASQHRYAFLAVAPLLLLIGLFGQERRIRIDNALELGHAYRGTAFLLGGLIEADDRDTGAHSRDVVSLAADVAQRMGLDSHAVRSTELVALLHDVGKIRVPKEIVNKPGPLTDTEWLVVKQHTVWGEEMLAAVGGLLAEVGTIVRSCHERYDGEGYPDGLAGEDIPLIARIIFVCDAFSAITTDRPYRRGRPVADAIAELRRCAGTQFDPRVVDVLAAAIGIPEEHDAAPPQLSLAG